MSDEGELVIPAECLKRMGIMGEKDVIVQVDDSGLLVRVPSNLP